MAEQEKEPMPIVAVHIPKQMLVGLDELVRRGVYPNRSEAIRAAIAQLLQRLRDQDAGAQEEGDIPLLRGRW